MAQVVTPIEVFCSYAHEDEALQKRLKKQLSPLIRQGLITFWYDRQINAGSLWANEIDTHLKSAQIILLLISPDFIDSDYCYGIEMKQALARHDAGEARVIPIILRPVDLQGTPFEKLQALPKDAKPVVSWPRQDEAFLDIAKGIRVVVEEMNGTKSSSPQQNLSSSINKDTMLNKEKNVGDAGNQAMESVVLIKLTPKLKIAITHYYDQLEEFKGIVDYELAVRSAFQNLLAEFARSKNWILLPEQILEGNIKPDGTLRDNAYQITRGYWEAKGPNSNLDREIENKIESHYPLSNIIFENTKRAVLYQNKKRVGEYNLTDRNELIDLLRKFFSYTEPAFSTFETAVKEFKTRIPELAKQLIRIIEEEYTLNRKFIKVFNNFAEICRASLNPKLRDDEINEMLAQHLLTVRIFRTVFKNSKFTTRNIIASEIEKVIDALTSRVFSIENFLEPLDRFYFAIEGAAKEIDGWTARQQFLTTVYERFFQGFSVKQADTYGIVYTPQPIVDFMCASVEEAMKQDLGLSISEPNVQILDPATGTGSYIINFLHRIPRLKLKNKYLHDLFCNEIMLLPYYIASLNIEHEYFEKMGEYETFEGICFADTLELAKSKQLSFLVEENTERVQRQQDAQIMVVIGNPPYNAGQKNENDNNKNRKYPIVDERVYETYVKGSRATNTRAVGDAYVRFFRWATDRIGERDGIVCFISNNSFVHKTSFDMMRKRLAQDFTLIYHLDLHGDVAENPKLSGTTHNVFGIKEGVGITLAMKSSKSTKKGIYYYRVPEFWRRTEKLAFLAERGNVSNIQWNELYPDERYNWITTGLRPEFYNFLPIGNKDTRSSRSEEVGGAETRTIFKAYSRGAETTRDNWMYDFNSNKLATKAKSMIETYNAEVSRWVRAGSPSDIDRFVISDEKKIKWSSSLKQFLQRKIDAVFTSPSIRKSLYRPFTLQFLYFDNMMTHRQGMFTRVFPTKEAELENIVVCMSGVGSNKPFQCLAVKNIPCLDMLEKTQCFPFYIYAEDGTNRRENITDWALQQFRERYGNLVTKWDILYYMYAMLHNPDYRELYVANLKNDLPHIALVKRKESFEVCVRIGKQLVDLHAKYEQVKECDNLKPIENEATPFSWRVERMYLTPDKSSIVINKSLTLANIPQECFEYKLGGRSALEWVIDQYQIKKDENGKIVSDPNNLDDEEYIVQLVGKVVTVSVETVRLVDELAQAVTMEDWLPEEQKSAEEEEEIV